MATRDPEPAESAPIGPVHDTWKEPRGASTFGWTLFKLVAVLGAVTLVFCAVMLLSLPVGGGCGRSSRGESMRHLSQLGVLYQQDRMDRGTPPRFDGAALWLSYRVLPEGGIKWKQEDLLFCPNDPHARRPQTDEERREYDDFRLDVPTDWADRCSFAGRDFGRYPLQDGTPDLEIIGAVRQGRDGRTPHFEDGIVVLYEDGSVKYEDLESLGLSRGAKIIVGPDSTHPELAKLIYSRQPFR